MDNTTITLQKAYQLIKAGHKQQALDLLIPVARAEPNNDQVWHLLGFAHTDPAQRIHAFEQVLRIDPTNQPAQKQLDKLRAASAPVNKSSIEENIHEANAEAFIVLRWVLGIGGAFLLCLVVFVFGAWWMLKDSPPTPAAASAPVTATSPLIPAQNVTPLASPTRGPSLSPSARASVTPYPRRATWTPTQTATITVTVPTPTSPPIIFETILDRFARMGNTESKSGSLIAGQAISVPIDIDNAGAVTFTLSWVISQPITYTITTPSGQLIDEAYTKANPDIAVFSQLNIGYSYYIKKSSVGVWKVNLQAPKSGYYSFSARFFETSLLLHLGSNSKSYTTGELAYLAVRVEDNGVGITGARVTGTIDLHKAPTQSIIFVDLGNGLYQFVYRVTNALGPVLLSVHVSGTNQGIKFTRHSSYIFEILP